MRELRIEEMDYVAGGLVPVTDLPGITVRPPAGGSGGSPAGNPPSTGGGSGGSGGAVPAIGGGPASSLNVYQQAGINRIKAELGVDLTYYALLSPTFANEVSLAVSSYGFDFKFASGGSFTDRSTHTVTIDSQYKNDVDRIVQQISHEASHVSNYSSMDARTTPKEVWITDYMKYEGYAVIANETVRNEIMANGGADIRVSGDVGNWATYQSNYEAVAHGLKSLPQAASDVGQYMSNNEHLGTQTYHQYYEAQYYSKGGR